MRKKCAAIQTQNITPAAITNAVW